MPYNSLKCLGQESRIKKIIIIELCIIVKQGQRELFRNCLQTLTKAIQIGVTDPEVR